MFAVNSQPLFLCAFANKQNKTAKANNAMALCLKLVRDLTKRINALSTLNVVNLIFSFGYTILYMGGSNVSQSFSDFD